MSITAVILGGEKRMDTYSLCIKVKDGDVEGILSRLGVLTVEKEEAASGN